MNSLEAEFLDAFKEIESLCNDAFSCQSGVTEYIEEMKKADAVTRMAVPSWESDLRMLKHLRYVRNKIAHDSDASGCTAADLRNAKDFFARLVNGEDPIALAEAEKRRKAEKPKSVKKRVNTGKTTEPPDDDWTVDAITNGKRSRADTAGFDAENAEAVYDESEEKEPPRGCLYVLLGFVIAAGIALIVLALLEII